MLYKDRVSENFKMSYLLGDIIRSLRFTEENEKKANTFC